MLWEDRDAWISVWAGALGAIPAAVLSAAVAAWVAVTVLNRSNKHQKKIAEEAAKEQARLSAIQLEEQKQLSGRQLAEQRKEAAEVRRNQVMADLVSAANGFELVADKATDAIDAQRALFLTHAHRWTIETQDTKNGVELMLWANLLWTPARYLSQLTAAPAETRRAWRAFLGDVQNDFTSSGLTLVGATGSTALSEFIGLMRARREEFHAQWFDDLANRPGGTGGSDPSRLSPVTG